MSRSRVPVVAAYLALAIGVVNIVRAVHPAFWHTRFAGAAAVLPGVAGSLAGATSLVAGILLIMIAHALRRRKRRAWRLVIVLLPVSALAEVLRWGHFITAAITTALFVVLLAARKEFFALSDPRTRRRSLWVLLLLCVADVAVGWAVVNAHSRAMIGAPSVADRFQEVLLGLVGLDGPVRFTTQRTADLVYFSLLGLGALTAVMTLYLALRPDRPVSGLSPEQERAVRELLKRYGARDSLGYFALRRDKARSSPRRQGRDLLPGGGRRHAGQRRPDRRRRGLARGDQGVHGRGTRHAWVPAVIGCSQTGGKVWIREAGLSALEIGDEAVVEVAGFGLEGRAMRNVRQMVNRIERAGYICRVRRGGTSATRSGTASGRLRRPGAGRESERGFSMALGRIGDPADPDCVVVTAHKVADPGDIAALAACGAT